MAKDVDTIPVPKLTEVLEKCPQSRHCDCDSCEASHLLEMAAIRLRRAGAFSSAKIVMGCRMHLLSDLVETWHLLFGHYQQIYPECARASAALAEIIGRSQYAA